MTHDLIVNYDMYKQLDVFVRCRIPTRGSRLATAQLTSLPCFPPPAAAVGRGTGDDPIPLRRLCQLLESCVTRQYARLPPRASTMYGTCALV